jgi:pimeloyl-ACP methyl ester carboxylesterase
MMVKKNIIIVNGKQVFYWEKNHQHQEVLVLLHGFPGNHMGLVDLANNLGNNYRVIIPDLPACGQSQDFNGRHNLKHYSDWLNDFLESLSISEAIIIGHSFGSRVALVFSMMHAFKVKKLILITPVLEVDGFLARIAALYYNIAKILPNYFQKIWLSNGFVKEVGDNILFKSKDKVLQQQIINRDIKELKKINQKVIVELFNEFYKFKLIVSEERIKAKSLVIASDKDEIATLKSVKILVSQLNGPSFEIMKNSGHLVPLERPLATAEIIKSWLK